MHVSGHSDTLNVAVMMMMTTVIRMMTTTMMMMTATTAKMMVMVMIKLRCRLKNPRLDEKRTFCLVTHNKMQFKVYPPQHTVTYISDYRQGLD